MYAWIRSRVGGIHAEPSDISIIALCFLTFTTLYGRELERVVVVDKVGGTDERLLGAVHTDDEESSSEKLVKVDMVLEEGAADAVEPFDMLERRLCSVNSVKVEMDEDAGRPPPLRDAESSSRSANVVEEAGDGKSYGW